MKKRRYKEIDSQWDLNIDQGSNSLIAVEAEAQSQNESDRISTSSRKGNNRRCIKLQYKNINRMCLEMDLARGKKQAIAGISEHYKVVGNFAIIIYDL